MKFNFTNCKSLNINFYDFFSAGKHAIFDGVKLFENLTWGIAGRSKEKLQSVLKEVSEKTNVDLSKIPIIIADVNDEKSLQQMAERAKVSF